MRRDGGFRAWLGSGAAPNIRNYNQDYAQYQDDEGDESNLPHSIVDDLAVDGIN